VGLFKSLPDDESAKPDLLLKIERFIAKAAEVKGKGRNTLPKFIQDDLAKKIATQNRQGVLWLPRQAKIVPKDSNCFEGGYGVVRMVEIHEVEAIPPYIEFAGKTIKLKDNLEHRKSRSTKALACPIDHPGIIKVMYLDRRTYKSFTLWWNGGSLFAMRHYDRKYKQDQHESELLRSLGPDYEARKRLVLYRKKRAHLAWALMNIMAAVSVEDVLHNDLSPNNILLHFPINDDNVVNIGVCDRGLTTWTCEVALSLYGKPNDTQLDEAKKRYNWIAPELFHLIGKPGSTTSPCRAGKAHACTVLSDSYTVGILAKKMYMGDSTSELFQKNRDPASTRYRFEQALKELTAINPEERPTIVHVVNILKDKPYYMEEPSMCYRQST
jgi:serine/threonine protein kinase